MKSRKLLVAIALTATLAAPQKSIADKCYPLVVDLAMVNYSVLMNSYDSLATQIITQRSNYFRQSTQAINASEREVQGALKAGIESNINSIAVTLAQHALATEVDKNGKNFSTESETALACPTELPTDILQGAADKRVMTDTLYGAMTERNQRGDMINKSMTDMKSRWSHANAAKVVTGENIFPADETLSEDQLIAGSFLTNFITNSLPAEKLNAHLAATGPGVQYAMIDTIKNVRISPAQKSFSLILGNSAPVYDMAEWLEDMKATSGELTVASKDGKISANAVLSARIDARYLDMKWIQENPKNKTGTLREIVLTKSIGLEVLRRRLEVAQHLRVVLATTLASQIELNFDDDLESSHGTMIEKTL